MFSRSDGSIRAGRPALRAGRPGVPRNARTLIQITAAVTSALSLLSVPYRLAQQRHEIPTKSTSYSLRKVHLDGFANSVVYAINQEGDAVGAAWNNDNDTFHPFVWRDGKATELPKPAGASEVMAVALNDRGEVAGAALISDDSSSAVVGVLWRGRRVVSTLAVPGRVVLPSAINDAGQVTGAHSEPG